MANGGLLVEGLLVVGDGLEFQRERFLEPAWVDARLDDGFQLIALLLGLLAEVV